MESKTVDRGFDLVEILERQVYPRLTPQQIYDWAGHNFKESSGRLRGNPPWGESKSGTSFAVFSDLGFLDSHNGNEAGDPIKYIYSLKIGRYEYPKGKDWVETVKCLFEKAGVSFPEREWTEADLKRSQRKEQRQQVLRLVQDYCQSVLWSEVGEQERMHLTLDRGFSEEGLRDLGIGLYPGVKEVRSHLLQHEVDLEFAQSIGVLATKWEGYMIFPWLTPHGQPLTLYGHQTKDWAAKTGKPKKYALFNPKDEDGVWLHTKESPYLFDRAIKDRHKEIVLVEGITDAAIAHQFGDTRVVACVAAMLSKDQVQSLARYGVERVIIALDPDAAGDEGIESCIKSLSQADISPYVAPRLIENLDPDEYILDYGIESWKHHTSLAVHGYRWKAERILSLANLDSDIGKENATKSALSYASEQKNQLAVEQYFFPALSALNINSRSNSSNVSSKLEKTLSEFEQVISKLSEISSVNSKAQQFYDYTKFRKEIGLSDRELKQLWSLSKLEKKPFEAICVREFIGENPESREWLIPKFIPSGSLLIWYAEGGKGKTLMAYDAVRAIAAGESWLGSRVHKAHKCLIIQTEESKADTQDRLIIQGYLESVSDNQVLISNNFTFSQIDELAEFIKKHEISLVVVDSLTTANQDNSSGENDVAYGNTILELREKVVDPIGCAVLIIHHENKNFSMRGSSAIKANVDFVARLHMGGSEDKLSKTERIFELEKARGGVMGRFLINLDTFNYRWSLVGEVDEYGNRKAIDSKLPFAIYNHLELNPVREFTVKEIFQDMGEEFSIDSIRTEVETLRRIGEIGGRYQQVNLEDGTRFGYWKYRAVSRDAVKAQKPQQESSGVLSTEDEIEEEF